MTTRLEIINQAFNLFGISYQFDLQPQQIDDAGKVLDAMLAGWASRGIRIGYVPGDNDAIIPDLAVEAVTASLAMRLAPGFGKSVSQDTKMQAREAYTALISATSQIIPQRINPGFTPAGAGNRRSNTTRPFLFLEDEPITTGQDGVLDI